MKLSSTRRALLLASIFNLLVALYFIIIAIVGLAQLRWYHQLTVSVRAHYFITMATSYFSFFILMFVGLLLVCLFASSSLTFASSRHTQQVLVNARESATDGTEPADTTREPATSGAAPARFVILRQTSLSAESNASACCSILLHLAVSVGLIVILVFWLFNTGELVRDNISSQLEYALARYQFTNRSSRFTIAIDGLQDSINCCGSLDYSDFPHGRVANLPPGQYPGSCCGKNIFGVNARVMCMGEEIQRAKQTTGCTTVLADYYDLISLLVVPVALICLFVNITIIALITISKGVGEGEGASGESANGSGSPEVGQGELATSGQARGHGQFNLRHH